MGKNRSSDLASVADGIGIMASAACAVHCLVTPALLVVGASVPLTFTFLTDDSVHAIFLWAVLPAAVVALGIGYRRHHNTSVLTLGAAGVAGLVFAVFAGHDVLGEGGERLVTLLSAGILIFAHVRNLRGCRNEACAHDTA